MCRAKIALNINHGDRPWAGASRTCCEWGGKGSTTSVGRIMGGFLEEAALKLNFEEQNKLKHRGRKLQVLFVWR